MTQDAQTCQFHDTEALATQADAATQEEQSELETLLKTIPQELAETKNRIEELFLLAINKVQNATIRSIACAQCQAACIQKAA